MNFQQILIIFFFPYLVSSSETVKRKVIRKRKADSLVEGSVTKVSKCSDDVSKDIQTNEGLQVEPMGTCEIAGTANVYEQDTIRNAQIAAHNQGRPILKLPEELRILIYSYLKCPYSNLPRVCTLFNESMKKYSLDLHFRLISSIKNTIPLKPSKDLARLMKLDNKFLNEGFDQLLSARTSYFTLDSPLFVGQMVRFIYKIFLGLQQVTEFDKLANEMTRSKYFESYLTFLKLVPDYKYRFYDIDFVFGFIKFLKQDESTFLSNLDLLAKSFHFPIVFLKHLFSLPDISDLESIVSYMDLNSIDRNVMIKSIAESFSLLDFENLTAEQIKFIQERNSRYIDQYSNENASEFIVSFAKLCSELASPDYKDCCLPDEFFHKLVAYVNASGDDLLRNKAEMKSFFDILLRIAIKRAYLKLFTQLVNTNLTSKQYIENIESRMNLKDYPEFVASLSHSVIKNIFGARSISEFLKHGKLSLEDASEIKDSEVRFMVQIELESDNDSLKKTILAMEEFMLPRIIKHIIDQSKNPARTIHKVFAVVKDRNFRDDILVNIRELLGTSQYLQSLLKPENEDIFEFPRADLYIKLNNCSFKTFLELSKAIGTERLKPLLKHLVIDWKSIVGTEGLLASDFDLFFKVLGLKISSYDVIKNKSKADWDAIDFIECDSRCLFVEPKVDPKYIFEVLLIEVDFTYCDELKNPYSSVRNETNPFRMKYFGIYEFIMEKNLEAFVSLVPNQVFSAFKPKIPNYLVKKALMSPVYRRNFADRILLESFPPKTVHNISISSIDELNVYTTTFYSDLYMFYADKFYLTVYIDWERIINDAAVEQDFRIITKFLDPKVFEEKVLTLNRSSKLEDFISFYYQNRHLISLKQIE